MTHPINSYQNCDDESHVHPYDTNAEAEHAELLAKIDPRITVGGRVPQYDALRAVVELHRPYDPELENLEGQPSACHHCNVLYPCSTIQAIEKELR